MIAIRVPDTRAEEDRETESDSIYLDIRARILQAQFLPDQSIDRAGIVSHFSATRAAADQAVELLASEGYLVANLRGGYVVRRFSPEEVRGTLGLARRLILVGMESLAEDADEEINARLLDLVDWDDTSVGLDPEAIEEFTRRTKHILELIMQRPAADGVLSSLRLLSSHALHRLTIRLMSKTDVRLAWRLISLACRLITTRDLGRLPEYLLRKPDYENRVKSIIARVNDLPASPTASFYQPLPEFHSVIGDDPSHPYFGLGGKEK